MTKAEHEAAIVSLEAKLSDYARPNVSGLAGSFDFRSAIESAKLAIAYHKQAIQELDGPYDEEVQAT